MAINQDTLNSIIDGLGAMPKKSEIDTPTNNIDLIATNTTDGLMSASDKSKLDGVAVGANKYIHPETSGNKHIPSGGSDGQILKWESDGTAKWATETKYGTATTTSGGLMSSTDKKNLDAAVSKLSGIAEGANNYSLPMASNSQLGGVKTTSTVTSTSGLTACPIINGVPYYKDTYNEYSLPTASNTTLGGVKTTSDVTSTTGLTACPIIAGVPYYKEILVDDTISSTSTNPVQSKAINTTLSSMSQNIGNTYALKSKYGNTTIDVGRKSGTTVGSYSTAEGYYTTASGDYSHAEGYKSNATGNYSHAEGYSSKVITDAIADFSSDTTNDDIITIHNDYTTRFNLARGTYSHVEGDNCLALANYSHAEGYETIASGTASHAEGYYTTASGNNSHAEGGSASSSGSQWGSARSVTIDESTTISLVASKALGHGSHAEGSRTLAYGFTSHSEGYESNAIGAYSHAEGNGTTASGSGSHAEGYYNTSSGNCSHAEGIRTTASGADSHAEGYETTASGTDSHAEGIYTTASNFASHAGGHYNAAMTNGGALSNTKGTAFVIGKGTSSSALANAFSIQYNGTVKAASTITASTTADYAEFFEWLDENPDNEDRVGYFVTLDGDKIRIASNKDDYILGVVSGEPFVLGNGDCDTWNGMFLRDEFRRVIYEPAPKIEEILDDDNNLTGEYKEIDGEYEGTRPKLNPDYDYTKPYISRFDRKEWAPVGMLGVLAVRHDGTAKVNGYVTVNENGIATACDRTTENSYRVIKSNSESVVEIIFR